jgi:hypothetical protein
MKTWILLLFALASALVPAASAGAGAPTRPLHRTPSLRIVTVPGYRFAVAGRGWGRRAILTFALHLSPPVPEGRARITPIVAPFILVQGIELRATRGGAFVVGVNTLPAGFCATVEVRDLAAHRLTVPRSTPAGGCAYSTPLAARVRLSRTTLTVLKGTLVRPVVVPLLRGTAEVTVHLGDALYLREPGPSGMYQPVIDDAYLATINHGLQLPVECPAEHCPSGFVFWEWIAVKKGTTTITLNPSCRQSKPPCAIPSFAITVHIIRRR